MSRHKEDKHEQPQPEGSTTPLAPSEVSSSLWLYATPPNPRTEDYGRWLVFLPPKEADTLWLSIAQAVQDDRLPEAKISTASRNLGYEHSPQTVIVVYTPSSQIEQVARELVACGASKGYYKSSQASALGLSRPRGDTNISSYSFSSPPFSLKKNLKAFEAQVKHPTLWNLYPLGTFEVYDEEDPDPLYLIKVGSNVLALMGYDIHISPKCVFEVLDRPVKLLATTGIQHFEYAFVPRPKYVEKATGLHLRVTPKEEEALPGLPLYELKV